MRFLVALLSLLFVSCVNESVDFDLQEPIYVLPENVNKGIAKSSDYIPLPEAIIEKVYDGDTFYVTFPGVPTVLGKNIPVRILGIDTPELRTKNAEEKAKALISKNKLVEIISKSKKVELRNVSRDKYFRLDADVFADGVNVGQMMLDLGLAKPYDGGTKPEW